MGTTETPNPKRKGLTDPLSEEDYQRVKSNYPNIVFNDEDQSFTTRKGTTSYARRLKFFRPMPPEEIAMGRAAIQERKKSSWEKFLTHVESGLRLSDAAKRSGFTYSTVRKRYNADPDFRKKVEEAEMRAAEPVEDSLFSAALNGNVPAAIKWLEKRAPERWPGDKTVIEAKNIYEIDASDRIANIVALFSTLQERQQLDSGQDIIDVEADEPQSESGDEF